MMRLDHKYSVLTSSTKFLFYFNFKGTFQRMKQTFKPYTLVGPSFTRWAQEPLAVLCLKNRLYMSEQKKNERIVGYFSNNL